MNTEKLEILYGAKLLSFERLQASNGKRDKLPCDVKSNPKTLCAEGAVVLEKLKELNRGVTSREMGVMIGITSYSSANFLRKLWTLGYADKRRIEGPPVIRKGQRHPTLGGTKKYWRNKNSAWEYWAV